MRDFLLLAIVGACTCASAIAEDQPPLQKTLPEGLVLTSSRIPGEITGTLRSINERLSRDLKPSENAVVFLVQIFGSEALDAGLRDATLTMLGIEALSPTAPQILYSQAFVESQQSIPADDRLQTVALLEAQVKVAGTELWNRERFPLLFEYLHDNQTALNAVVAASQQARYFAPLLTEEEPPRLLAASFALERRLPFLARCLAARATLQVNEHQGDDVVFDLCAGHRLAKLLAEGSPLDVSAAKAHIIDAIASWAAAALLEKGALTGPQARLYLRELEQIGPLAVTADQADQGERAILHQEIELLQSDKTAIREFFGLPAENMDAGAAAPPPDIDWSISLKRADEIQDQIVRALRTHDRTEQERLFKELDRGYEAWNDSADEMTQKFAGPAREETEAVSRWLGETMAWSLRPLYRQRRLTDDRAEIRRSMILVALGLVAYRSDRGEFPVSLADLAPAYLKTVPEDAHTGRPFTYVRENPRQARLASWGANGTDDAGSSFNDDQVLELR